MRITYIAITFLFLAGVSLAQTVNTAMIVTDITNVDAATASAAASKAGIPVLVAENGLLTDEIKNTLQATGVTTVILVGGPAVIKPEAEQELRSLGYTTVRLWGFERTGTAVAVARYFWPEGSGCAVLVDDTKNSTADSRRQLTASNLAARFNCTLIPVPEGAVPAEVLALLNDLGVKEVKFVGKKVYPDIRSILKEFRLKEITGSDDQIENETENEILNETLKERKKPRLVIVATPDWKAAVAFSAHPNSRSVVRFVSNSTNLTKIISFIKDHNLTDIRVVGLPGLAQQITEQLQGAGINVTVTLGRNANEIAANIFREMRIEWKLRHDEDNLTRVKFRLKIRANLETELNETIEKLDEVEAELEALANTTEKAEVKALIDAARARISEIRSLLISADFDNASRLIADIKFRLDEKRFLYRDKLRIKIQDEVDDEEDSIDEQDARIGVALSGVESRLLEVRGRCANADIVDAIVTKAKSLRISMQAAKAAGNLTNASLHLAEVRELVKIANSIAEACRQRGVVPGVATMIKEHFRIRSEIKAEEGEEIPMNATVNITASGVKPSTVKIRVGGTVTFINKDTAQHWPASAVHPTHEVYPGSSISKCGTAEASTIFDACKGLAEGETFVFTFNHAGSWKYHDHMNAENSAFRGTIEVK